MIHVGRDPLAGAGIKPDIAGVATLLKRYFRELPTPLFGEKYEELLNCMKHENLQDQLVAIRSTIEELHPAIITVMKYLFRFLYRVSCNAAENKMKSKNLAVVFGPVLITSPTSTNLALVRDLPTINEVTQLCIDRYKFIFGGDEEEKEGGVADVDSGANVIPDDTNEKTDPEDGRCTELLV